MIREAVYSRVSIKSSIGWLRLCPSSWDRFRILKVQHTCIEWYSSWSVWSQNGRPCWLKRISSEVLRNHCIGQCWVIAVTLDASNDRCDHTKSTKLKLVWQTLPTLQLNNWRHCLLAYAAPPKIACQMSWWQTLIILMLVWSTFQLIMVKYVPSPMLYIHSTYESICAQLLRNWIQRILAKISSTKIGRWSVT